MGGGSATGGGSAGGGAPTLVDSVVVAQKETEGTQVVTTALSTAGAGQLLVSLDAIRTALFPGPPALNNGNTFPTAPLVTEAYTPGYPQYSLRIWARANVVGGAAHTASLTRLNSFSEECTAGLFAFSRGAVTSSSSVVRNPAGANATLTSASFTIANGPARVLAIWSGSGDINATAPTATITDAATWGAPIHAIAFGSGAAPSGHIPLTVWTAELAPGTYTWSARPTINEGAIMITLVVQ